MGEGALGRAIGALGTLPIVGFDVVGDGWRGFEGAPSDSVGAVATGEDCGVANGMDGDGFGGIGAAASGIDGEDSKAGVSVGLPSMNDGTGATCEESPGASIFDGINVVGPTRDVGGLFVAVGVTGVIVVAPSVDSEGDIVGSTTSTEIMLISSNSVASGNDRNFNAFLTGSCTVTAVT